MPGGSTGFVWRTGVAALKGRGGRERPAIFSSPSPGDGRFVGLKEEGAAIRSPRHTGNVDIVALRYVTTSSASANQLRESVQIRASSKPPASAMRRIDASSYL